jgi:RNA polymerase sigma factor (TIGR02999 family)
MDKDLTQLLNAEDFAGKHDVVYPAVYENLHDIAERLFARERENHTLQPTMLLNEAYMNLVDQKQINYNGRSHFYAVGANAIRRLLVDHARKRNAVKRGSGAYKVDLEENQAFSIDDGSLFDSKLSWLISSHSHTLQC